MVEIARFSRVADAHQQALALAAKSLVYLIEREGDEWVLKVEEQAREAALAEIESVQAEDSQRIQAPPAVTLEKIPPLSLFLFVNFMGLAFLLQQSFGDWWMERGEADSEAILRHGEWWRTITAL